MSTAEALVTATMIVCAASCVLSLLALGLCRAAAREMPPMPEVEPAPAMPPTLARFIAERAADGIDGEWAALQREIGGAR